MRQSFIAPHEKPFLSSLSRLAFFVILVVVMIVLALRAYFVVDMMILEKDTLSLTQERQKFETGMKEADRTIDEIIKQKARSEEIFLNNTVLKESIKNLFDLIPQQITLQYVEIDRSSLILQGTTPTQETFESLLSIPLKSIFHTSQTTFRQSQQGGGYTFISVNRVFSDGESRDE